MKRILFLFILLNNMNLFSQKTVIKNIDKAREISNKVAALFTENKIAESFDLLDTHWPLPQNEIDAVETKTIRYLNILKERFGKSIGYSKINEEHILNLIIRETYLIRYNYTAIRLQFVYYKNNEGWIINTFKWDDSFENEFKQQK